MGTDLSDIGILKRREIEAGIAGPLIKAFTKELGKEKTLEVVQDVIASLGRESGEMLREVTSSQSLESLQKGLSLWSQDDALTIDVVDVTPRQLSVNMTRCRYAEMYKRLGLADLGFSLSCARDYALVEGYNPAIKLERTQTIMQGASHCDFRFTLDEEE